MKIPNLGQNMFVPRQENILDGLFNMFGSIISGSIGADAADTQTAAQLQANYEQIAAQREESDKAFKRNSSIGQKAQLMAAGLSEQQAMQVIAGNAMTGEYQPAETGNAMEGVDLSAAGRARADAALGALSGVGSSVSELGKGLYDSIRDPEGGNLGAMQGTPLMNMISENLSLVDRKKVHTFADFENWVKGLDPKSEAGKVFIPMLESKEFKKVKRFSPAQLFCTASFGRMYTAAMDSNQAFKARLIDIDLKEAEIALTDEKTVLTVKQQEMQDELIKTAPEERHLIVQKYITEQKNTQLVAKQVLGAQYDYLIKKMNYDIDNSMYDVIFESRKQTLLAQTAESIKMAKLNNNPDYLKWFLESQAADAQGQYYLCMLNALSDQTKYTILKSRPEFSWIVKSYDLMNSSGMNTGLITGQIINALGIIEAGVDHYSLKPEELLH